MLNLQLATKYAKAIFLLAKEEKKLDAYQKELFLVTDTIFSMEDFRAFLTNPLVQKDSKKDLLEKAFAGVLSDTMRNFLFFMVDKKREGLLLEVARIYEKLLDEEKGIEIADVTTARNLDATMHKKLQTKLEQITGKLIKIRPHIDEHIIGGVIVRMGDTLIDGSARGQLASLKEQLLAN